MDVYERKQSSVVAVHQVPPDWVSRYGIIDGEIDSPETPNLHRVRQLVEKPTAADAPSDLAIAGRYIFTPDIFAFIDQTGRGVGDEIQLTDAMNLLAKTQPVYALAWNAKRYDIGNRIEYARCFIDFALRRPDTAEAMREHVRRAISQI